VQASLRNLEVALEPVLNLSPKDLADQACLKHHVCHTLSAMFSSNV